MAVATICLAVVFCFSFRPSASIELATVTTTTAAARGGTPAPVAAVVSSGAIAGNSGAERSVVAAIKANSFYIPSISSVLEGLSFAMIIKALCLAGNVLVQVSPITQVKRWEVRGCTGEADAAPYVSICFGGWQWCFYGLFAWLVTKRSAFLILVHSNCLGALLGTYYTITFFRNCRDEISVNSLQRYLSAVAALVLLQVCAISVLPAERALFISGLISSFCSLGGAASSLVTLPLVIRTRDSSSIPGPFVVASLASAVVWCICGCMLDDPLVVGPNVFSFFANSFSLSLKYRYPASDMKGFKDEETMGQEDFIVDSSRSAFGMPAAPFKFRAKDELKPLKLMPFVESLDESPGEHVPLLAVVSGSDGTGGTF